MVRNRVRLRVSKQGDLRFIGHRDLMRCLERVFRRAELPLQFSEGFHPKPRMTFPLALAVGIEAIDEVVEFELAEEVPAEELLRRIKPQLPTGLALHRLDVLPPGSKKARVRAVAYEVEIPPRHRPGLEARAERLTSAASVPVRRREATLDLRPLLAALDFDGRVLSMRLWVTGGPSIGPREVLQALGLPELEHEGVCLRRTGVELDV